VNIAILPSANGMNNNIFSSKEETKLKALKEVLEEKGHCVKTIDLFEYKEIDILFVLNSFSFGMRYYIDMIKVNQDVKVLYHIIEPDIVEPLNVKRFLKSWSIFDAIFTFRDDFVDNTKFFKLHLHNWPDLDEAILDQNFVSFAEKSFLCLINARKTARFADKYYDGVNLYRQRIKLLEYFGSKKEIDLYGRNWANHYFEGPIFDSYKGEIDDKITTLKNYKFSICIENQGEIDGYLSEKIFDCFEAGVVPIYQGPRNIDSFIPRNTYISYSKFGCMDELRSYLKNMSEAEYLEIINNARVFIGSEAYNEFKISAYLKSVLPHFTKENYKKKSYWKVKGEFLKTLLMNPRLAYHKKRKGFLYYTLTK